ncbi:unnamed protein product, partial [marine sediment metagenome]
TSRIFCTMQIVLPYQKESIDYYIIGTVLKVIAGLVFMHHYKSNR